MAATGRISSVIDKKAVEAEVRYLENKLNSILSQFKNLAVNIDSVNSKLKSSKTSGDANAIISQNNALTQKGIKIKSDYEKATIELAKAQERLNYLNNEGAKLEQELYLAREKVRQKKAEIIAQTKQENRTIEQQIAAAKRQVNSIEAVEAESKKLMAIKKQLNTDDKEQLKYLQIINSRLDENTAYLRANGDEATKQRMNIGNYGSALNKVGNIAMNVAGALGLSVGLAGAFKVAGDVMKSTEQISDKLDYEMAGLGQSIQQLFRNIASGDWSNLLDGMREAYQEGKRYAEVMDYIQDVTRSKDIQNAEIDLQIIEQRTKARDKSLSLAERQAAIDQIVSLGQQKLQNDLKVTGKTLQNELTNAAQITGVASGVIKTYLTDYEALVPSMQKGQQILSDIEKRNTTITKTPYGSSVSYVNRDAINKDISSLSRLEQTYVSFAQIENKLLSDSDKTTDRNKISAALIANTGALQAEAENRSSLVKMRNGLYKELIAEDEDYARSSGKATDDRNRYLLEAQKRYQESQINLMQDAEAQEKARINLKFDNEIADLRAKNVLSTELEASLLAERNQELTAVTVKYAKERAKAEQDALNSYYSLMQSQVQSGGESNQQFNQLAQIKELQDLSAKYIVDIQDKTGEEVLKLTEQYEALKNEIVQKHEKERLQMAINTANALVELMKLQTDGTIESEQKILAAEKALNDAKIALANSELEAIEKNNKSKVDSEKKTAEQIKAQQKDLSDARWKIAEELNSSLGSLAESYYESQSQKLDALAEKDEKNKEKELERAEGNQELTERINKKYDEKQEQREKKEKEINIAKAKAKKLEGVFSIIISTAKAIAEHLATPELIPFDIAMGAIQEAVVLAQPLPKYFKGRENGKAEFAHVGERGFEGVVTKENKMFITPDRDTVTFLPEGAKVIPHDKMMKMAENMTASKLPLWSSSITSSDMRMLRKDVKALQGGFKMVAKVISSKPEYHSNLTAKGLEKFVKRGNSVTKYIEKSIKF